MNEVPRLFARYKITYDRRFVTPYAVWVRWWRFYLIPTWGFSEHRSFDTYEEAVTYIYNEKMRKQTLRVDMSGSVFF